MQKRGVTGLWAGATATMASESAFSAASYSVFRATKEACVVVGMPESVAALVASSQAAVVGSFIYTPCDLVKIRLQRQARGEVRSS